MDDGLRTPHADGPSETVAPDTQPDGERPIDVEFAAELAAAAKSVFYRRLPSGHIAMHGFFQDDAVMPLREPVLLPEGISPDMAAAVLGAPRTLCFTPIAHRGDAIGTARLEMPTGVSMPAPSPGRRAMLRRLAADLAGWTEGAEPIVASLIDLRHFHAVRDGAGHVVADVVLKQVAERILIQLPPHGRLFHINSDVFGTVWRQPGGTDPVESLQDLIARAFRLPFEIDGMVFRLRGLGGTAVFPTDFDTEDDLLRGAEIALTLARRGPAGTVGRVDRAALIRARDDLRLAGEIEAGLRERQFLPFAQPIVDLETGRMIGAEILARWIHPTEGFIPPTRFIPLAERHALTTDLTIEMLRGVAQAWKDGGRSDVRLSVNLSPHDLNWPSMNRIVNAIREEHLFPIDRLTMELTETAMMENPTVAREVLNNLRSMGIKIAVDDFGTGYSSLSNLHTLPIDYLKIDRSFVSEVEMGNDWTRMIGAIQAMADGLGLQTVAEGIETDATTRALRQIGCHQGQGYAFGAPEPLDVFLRRSAAA
ncbi:MAG: putative bifunctional diguanylate cyclase/phosphodiesterase [Rhodospirillales bacterium]